jgi:hypothetical protein
MGQRTCNQNSVAASVNGTLSLVQGGRNSYEIKWVLVSSLWHISMCNVHDC